MSEKIEGDQRPTRSLLAIREDSAEGALCARIKGLWEFYF